MKSSRWYFLWMILIFAGSLLSCVPKVTITNLSSEKIKKSAHGQVPLSRPTENVLSSGEMDTPSREQKTFAGDDLQLENAEELPEMPETSEEGQMPETRPPDSHDQIIENEFQRILAQFGEDDLEAHTGFLNEVKKNVRFFQVNQQWRDFILASLKRSSKYLAWVKAAFRKRGIPEDMVYIAFIESGFNPRAISSAGASGMWQFIPATARNYSLKVTTQVDERFDPVKSTFAAIEYFHDLISIFGPKSFLLAMAAYNCGEARVISCLKEIDDPFLERNFWHIRPCLPLETREFAPRIISTAIIGNHPEAFGFPKFEQSPEDRIPVTNEEFNPYKPRITQSVNNELLSKLEKSKAADKSAQNKIIKEKVGPKPVLFTVKKGNTLTSVAEAFDTETLEISRWNRIQGGKLLIGQTLKIYTKSNLELVKYTVKKGDTLSDLCESFGVRSRHILVINGLENGSQIKSGQTLCFYKPVKEKPLVYTVVKGTNLTSIAEIHQVTVKDLMMWNNLNSSTIYPHQKLKIYSRSLEKI